MDLNFDFDDQLEKLAKVPRTIRMAVVAAILVGVASGYWFFMYQPKADEVAMLRANAQQLQRKLSNIRAVASNVGEFEVEVAELERELEKALKQLPDSKQFEDLLRDISTAGKQVGVKITSLSREPEVTHDFYAEVPFRIAIEGNYHDLARFFERVGRLPRIVNVGALRVSVATEDRLGTQLRVEGTATTFRFLNEVPRAASATPRVSLRGRA